MKELFKLFIVFARIGGFTFGGGYAMLPIIQEEVVEKHQWASEEEVLDYYAIGQCTPGIIAINTATFIGYKQEGIPGAIAATAGMVAPSIVIITIIAAFFQQFQHLTWVNHAFGGVRVAVAALILTAVMRMWRTSVKEALDLVIFGFSFILVAFTKISPILLVIASAALGIIITHQRTDVS